MIEEKFFETLNYIDIGCSKGDSLDFLQKVLPLKRGIGIDIDNQKIKIAKERGFDVHLMDIFDIPNKKLINFSTLFHILEHLTPDISTYEFLNKIISFSKDFVFIRQPYFDADNLLAKAGLKFFWSDWHGHPNHMLHKDFVKIFERLREEKLILDYTIYGHIPILDSSSDTLLPLSVPIDQLGYDKSKHGEKPIVKFNFLAFREIMAVIRLNENIDNSCQVLESKCPNKFILNF